MTNSRQRSWQTAVARPGLVVDARHLAERGAGAVDGQRLLAHPGHDRLIRNHAMRMMYGLYRRCHLLEHLRAGAVSLLDADVDDAAEVEPAGCRRTAQYRRISMVGLAGNVWRLGRCGLAVHAGRRFPRARTARKLRRVAPTTAACPGAGPAATRAGKRRRGAGCPTPPPAEARARPLG